MKQMVQIADFGMLWDKGLLSIFYLDSNRVKYILNKRMKIRGDKND
jgi:hypothetical protein